MLWFGFGVWGLGLGFFTLSLSAQWALGLQEGIWTPNYMQAPGHRCPAVGPCTVGYLRLWEACNWGGSYHTISSPEKLGWRVGGAWQSSYLIVFPSLVEKRWCCPEVMWIQKQELLENISQELPSLIVSEGKDWVLIIINQLSTGHSSLHCDKLRNQVSTYIWVKI